jgi:DNA-binding transcriptional ArsR family regulator
MTVEQVLTALADPTRRQLLERLSAHGETTATVLAAELPVTRQAIVKHLSVLGEVGLVTSHKDGRERRYSVRPDQLVDTARWMNQVAGLWSARLQAIREIAEKPDQAT